MDNEGNSTRRFPLSNYCKISLQPSLPTKQRERFPSVFVSRSKQIRGLTLVNAWHLGSVRTSDNKDAIIAAAEGRTWRNSCDIDWETAIYKLTYLKRMFDQRTDPYHFKGAATLLPHRRHLHQYDV